MWTAKPLLVAYMIVVSTTVGLLVNRNAAKEESIPVAAGTPPHGGERELVRGEPPLWLQLFRPSLPTAHLMLRTALPSLPIGRSRTEPERRNLLILWTGRAGDRPQTLFQAALPFLRSGNRVPAESAPQGVNPGERPDPGNGQSVKGGGDQPDKGEGAQHSRQGGAEKPVTNPPAKEEGGTASPRPTSPPQVNTVLNGGLPLVGIFHTHDYEAYISEFPDLKVNTEQDLIRIASYDHSKPTIMDIGETLAHKLRDLGVTTVHAPFKHQELGYDYAYQSSRATAKQILKEAPSVKILMDLHRDGTLGLDSTTMIAGKPVARVRCVIGARDDLAHWQKNKEFCDGLMAQMEKANPGITLPTLTPQYRYNQDLLPGAILLEIGNALNRYDEAERAIGYLAAALVEMLREGKYPK